MSAGIARYADHRRICTRCRRIGAQAVHAGRRRPQRPGSNVLVPALGLPGRRAPEDDQGVQPTFVLIRAPEGMTISDSGLVEWVPEDEGTYPVTLGVSDGVSTTIQSYMITVGGVYSNLQISTARMSHDIVYPGDYVHLYVSVANEGEEDLEDVQITATLYELGLRHSSREFSLDSGEAEGLDLNLIVPYYAYPGDYYLKVSVGNDQFRDTTYRLITII